MRKKIIAGNWKMNTTLADAKILSRGVLNHAEHIEKIEIVLAPPTIWLTEIAHEVIGRKQHDHLKLAGQNMYFKEAGAYTGETSPLMLKEVADCVILGHSERTHVFKEDVELIATKVKAAFEYDLTPILCIGEDAKEEGSKESLLEQLKILVSGLGERHLQELVLAYEPVWAIGTGLAATPDYAEEVISLLRSDLTDKTRILYGGSVDDQNARGFLDMPNIDGLLIGGTSLKLKPFMTICQIADDLS